MSLYGYVVCMSAYNNEETKGFGQEKQVMGWCDG